MGILQAALFWFDEQIQALDCDNSAKLDQAKIRAEAIATALAQSSISEQLLKEVKAVFLPTIERLRNELYEGSRLKAYYFGGLFFSGREAVPAEFWVTEAANGMLEEGRYFPFGRPSRSFESRLNYPLLLLRVELDEVLNENEHPTAKKFLPKAKIPQLVAALREFDHLPSRIAQYKALRDLAQFQGYHLTDKILREAARQAPRQPGRRSNQQSD